MQSGGQGEEDRWPASRKFVSDCVAKTVQLTPAELQNIAVKQAIIGCKAEATGQEDRVARKLEIRKYLPLKRFQRLSS